MPPSGFSQKAINGLLVFVKDCYTQTLTEYATQSETMTESDFLSATINDLEETVQKTLTQTPLPLTPESIEGVTTFVTECYGDLVSEIYAGKDKYERSVVNGHAMEKEVTQISDYLTQFTI